MAETPNPGSKAAISAGCTCPVLDNGHGYGYQGRRGIFAMDVSCPIHGAEAATFGRKPYKHKTNPEDFAAEQAEKQERFK